jgi:hypothetical protein
MEDFNVEMRERPALSDVLMQHSVRLACCVLQTYAPRRLRYQRPGCSILWAITFLTRHE